MIALPVFIGVYYRGVGVHLIDVCRCFFFVFDFCLLPLGEILVCIGIILLVFWDSGMSGEEAPSVYKIWWFV